MANQALNNNQLKAMLMPKIKQAVDLLVQKIWNENRELVRKIVYEAYSPATYDRTGEFKEAWDTDSTSNVLSGKVQASFYYAPDKMSVETGVHSSIYGDDDYREYLAETIYQGLSGDFGYGKNTGAKRHAKTNPLFSGEPWANRRDVWKQLEKQVGRSKLKVWMKECFDKVGLPVDAHGNPWGLKQW